MGKGSSQTSTSQSGSTSPDSNAYQAYLALLNRASGVASTPYQGYQGEETAPINEQQQAGIGNINQIAGPDSKFIGQIDASGNPISAADIQRYQDPYTNQVINATQADFDVQNQRANSTVTGNAAAQGALGGDRVGVAQALTAEGQARVQAPVIAGLRSQGYQQAVNTAENQQQQGMRAGVSAQQAAMQGAQAQVGAGTLQQQTQQAQDTQKRQDYYQAQGYPFQVAQWLAGIDTAVGGSMGSTTTGQATTQGPTPNPWTQAAGLGLTAASMFIKDGGAVTEKRAGFAAGGSPYGNSQTWVPTMEPHANVLHATMPSAPQAPKQEGLSQDQMKGVGALAKKGWDAFNGSGTALDYGASVPDAFGSTSVGGPQGPSPLNPMYLRGGRIKGYATGGLADGGTPDFTERFDAAYPNMAAGVGASKPAYEPGGPTYDDGGGPFRLTPPEDLEDWRARVDRDNGKKISAAASDAGLPAPQMAAAPDEPLPPEVTAGVSSRRMTASAAPPVSSGEDTEALGYAGAPNLKAGVGRPQDTQAPEQSGGLLSSLGIKMTPELRTGLMQAGLAMMATTRGGPGSFLGGLGEAGMAGVGAYSKSVEAQQKHDLEQAKMAMEEAHFQQPYNQMTMAQKAAEARADRPYTQLTAAEKANLDREKYTPAGSVMVGDSVHPLVMEQGSGKVIDAVTGQPPAQDAKIQPKGTRAATLSPEDATAIARYTVATGDDSRVRSLGFNPENKALVQSAITKEMNDKNVSDQDMAQRKQEYSASGISKNAAARTRSTREENLNMILKATAAAVPAALEESEKVQRATGYVPLDRLIQHGQLITNDPNLVTFGMANLQLAEHWARAMNPMGVMRESDRDLALHYLDTAFSKGTYKKAVMQLQKQVTRERDAIKEGKTIIPENGQAQPGEVGPEKSEKPKPTQSDIDYARAHPEVKDKFIARFGVEP